MLKLPAQHLKAVKGTQVQKFEMVLQSLREISLTPPTNIESIERFFIRTNMVFFFVVSRLCVVFVRVRLRRLVYCVCLFDRVVFIDREICLYALHCDDAMIDTKSNQ